MFKKKFLIIITLIVVFTLMAGFTMEDSDTGEVRILPPGLDEFDIRILNNGSYIETNLNPIEKEEDFILVPLRLILESSGYRVEWMKDSSISISREKEKYDFDLKNSKYTFENNEGNIMVDYKYFEEIDGVELNYDMLTRTIILKSDYKDGDIYYYDLGKRTMKTSADKDLNYRLNGGLVIPKSDKNPLVVVLHGSHGATKAEDNRFDLGYSYLLKEFEKEGYFAISPNVTIQYSFEEGEPIGSERIVSIFDETINALIEANNGSKNFGMDLKNKIDFNKVILIGHSRSGHQIFELNNLYRDKKKIDIKGILGVAPAKSEDINYNQVDNPVGIILPELDGDVSFLDGQLIFDTMIDNPKRKSDIQLVYLYGANHNAFNEALLIQDEGNIWNAGVAERMQESSQREFLINYSKRFIASVLKEDFIPKELKLENNKLLGKKVLLSNYSKGVDVYRAENGTKNIVGKNVDFSNRVKSIDENKNTVGIFNHPGNPENLHLLNVKWKDLSGQLSFKVEEETKDKKELSLYLAQDSTDALNKKENQSLTLILKDGKGKSSSLLLDKDTSALNYIDGSVEFDGKAYSNHTPLSILDIDLDKFKEIDRDNIKELILKFDQTSSGSIYIRFISFK